MVADLFWISFVLESNILCLICHKVTPSWYLYDSLILFGRLINCSTSAGNLDLISCSVAKKPDNDLFKYLNKNSDININVSINITGHTSDWYLEQGNRELIGKYFNDNIQNLKIQLIA